MKVNGKLHDYIKSNIFPYYEKNDKGHDINHTKYVISRSIKFAETVPNINMDMVFTQAAYHDVGHHIDAKNHEKVSSEILMKDKNLEEFFTDEQIKIMADAVCDHRASLEYEPRTIYGKILSSADRNVSIYTPLTRTYEYRKSHFGNDNLDKIIEESREHILNKFGRNGYANEKMYFNDEEYNKFLEAIVKLAEDKGRFKDEYIRVNNLGKFVIKERLEDYKPFDEQEAADKNQMLKFIEEFDDVLTRDNTFGHFSASAFVLNESRTKTLVLHHNIFDGKIYPGGHADGEYNLLEVAKREVQEETALEVTPLYDGNIFAIQTLPIKGHVKKGKYLSSHLHMDFVYLFTCKDSDMDKIRILESENSEVKWIDLKTIDDENLVDFILPIFKKIYKRLEDDVL